MTADDVQPNWAPAPLDPLGQAGIRVNRKGCPWNFLRGTDPIDLRKPILAVLELAGFSYSQG
ncbi:MAG: hypothetical protein WAW96_01630, partial [Alphaproteobacteria bacterium]